MSELLKNCNYKVLKDNPNYYILDDGRLYSLYKQNFLKGQIMSNGYLRYTISLNGKTTRYFAHRLVAEYFVENPQPEKFNIVNHKDLNKANNNKNNLEWTDVQGNTQHAADNNKLCEKREREYYNEVLPDEKWVEIKGYPNYQISNWGRIKNKNNLLLKYWTRGNKDYYQVTLHDSLSNKKNYSVHILVYINFIGDIPNSYIIDHIDGNKQNNKLKNLRCISQTENVNNSYYIQKTNSRIKGVKAYRLLDDCFIGEFPSYAAAGRALNIDARLIRRACIDEISQTHGYYFKSL